jgi:hypothetical protein
MTAMNETIHEYLRRRLKEYQGRHMEICRDTGVPQSTISRIHGGAMPTLATAQPLLDWFEADDAREQRVPPPRRPSAVARGGRTGGGRVLGRRN